MGRKKCPVKKKVVGIYIPVELAEKVQALPDLSERTEEFWRQLVNAPSGNSMKERQKTIQTNLTEILEILGEAPFRRYFREDQQLAAEEIIITEMEQRFGFPVTPSELSAVMHSAFRGMAHV